MRTRWLGAAAATVAVFSALTMRTSREATPSSVCSPVPEPCEALAAAERVFYGEVLGTSIRPRTPDGDVSQDAINEVRFTLIRVLKGDATEGSEWSGEFHETPWAHRFKEGQQVVVFARRSYRGLLDTVCGRTRAFSAEDSRALTEELSQLESCRLAVK